ncbi:MAG: RNA 2',3'-cyclic phosphodiesterase [Haloferacaceae archaeon]
MRLFVSVDLPESMTAAVETAQDRFRDAAGLSFTDPTQAHVTVKFLGDADHERLAEVRDAVAAGVADADVSPFEASVGGFGVFPSLEYISVVWTGFRTGGAELTALHEGVERATTDVGFEEESHEFTPHVTLARMNDARGKDLVQRLVRDADPDLGTFTVDEVRLKESTLTDEGPEYDTVATFPLG